MAKSTSVSVGFSLSSSHHDRKGGKLFLSAVSNGSLGHFFFVHIGGGWVCDVSVARKQTGQGFMCNMTIKGPHGSSGGDASIFRGISRVPAFFRDVERYLTLKARTRGISVPLVRGLSTWMCVEESGVG